MLFRQYHATASVSGHILIGFMGYWLCYCIQCCCLHSRSFMIITRYFALTVGWMVCFPLLLAFPLFYLIRLIVCNGCLPQCQCVSENVLEKAMGHSGEVDFLKFSPAKRHDRDLLRDLKMTFALPGFNEEDPYWLRTGQDIFVNMLGEKYSHTLHENEGVTIARIEVSFTHQYPI